MPPTITDVTPDPNPTIKITFQGLVLAHLDDQIAQVGAVVSDPCHRPKIKITRKKNGKYLDEINLALLLEIDENLFVEDIRLDVVDIGQSGISAFQKGVFNRRDKHVSDPQDFRWFIDIAREVFEVEEPLAIDRTKIRPVFHVQNAVFYSAEPSRDECVIMNPDMTEKKRLGFITPAISANINLDRPESKAVLRIGSREIRTFDARDVREDLTYEILFDCDCACGTEPDFDLVFEALGVDLPPSAKVNLNKVDPDTGGASSHEVPCSGGQAGSSLR